MKKFLLLLLVINALGLQAQIVFQNPSFEGVSQAHVVPAPWVMCFDGGTPDTQPGQWGITHSPSNGQTYVSFLTDVNQVGNSYAEGLSQQLPTALLADSTYTFVMDVAFSNIYNTAEPADCYGSLGVWGGFGDCDKTELLWESGPITNVSWQPIVITITPSQNYTHISFGGIVYTPCSGFINTLVDNINGPFNPNIDYEIVIALPGLNQSVTCQTEIMCVTDTIAQSVTLLGGFLNSPVIATQINPILWKANVVYPQNFLGNSQIIAVANFGNNVFSADTVTVNINELNVDFNYFERCAGDTTIFTNITLFNDTTNIISHWDFGDNTSADGLQVNHAYSDTGVYVVQLTTGLENICINTTDVNVNINNLPPEPPVIVQNFIYLEVENYNPDFTYKWYNVLYTDIDTLITYYFSGPSITAGIGSSFFVEAIELNQDNIFCSSFSDIFYVEHVSVIENAVNTNVLIYPNPTVEGQINIELKDAITGATTIQIMNGLGQVLYNQKLQGAGKHVISNPNLAAGCYFISFNNTNFNYTTKLLVK